MFRGWCLATRTLQLPPQIFYGIKVWRLARPLQDLNVLLLEPLLCCLGHVFWVIVMLEYHPRPQFNALAGFNALALKVHCPFDAVQLSCPLSRKTPPNHIVSTSKHGVGMVLMGSQAAFLLQTRRVELMPKSWMLVSSDYNTFTQFSSESLANFRQACTCAFLSSRHCRISVLGHGGEFGIWLIDCFCRQVVFYTGNKLRLGALPLRECS